MSTLKVQIREGTDHNSKVDFSVTAALTLLPIALTTGSSARLQPDPRSPGAGEPGHHGFQQGAGHGAVQATGHHLRPGSPRLCQEHDRQLFRQSSEIPTAVNHTLQGRFDQAASDLGRFAVNSTVGVAGLFEVAEPALGIPRARQDFGQTLAHWGVGSGPYLVLPVFGPSTVRDGIGRGLTFLVDPVSNVPDSSTALTLQAGRAVDTRSQLLFFDKLVMGDEYLFVREAYLQLRARRSVKQAAWNWLSRSSETRAIRSTSVYAAPGLCYLNP